MNALQAAAEAASSEQEPAVIHSVGSLAQSLDGPIMVVGCGSAMKSTVKACVAADCPGLLVTGTDDKARSFSCSGAARVVSLGSSFDERLFSDEYSVVAAACKGEAAALLVCDADFAQSPLLREAAYEKGLRVFAPVPKDRSRTLWFECPPDAASDRDTAEKKPVAWRFCSACKLYRDERAVLANQGACPQCGSLCRLHALERIGFTFDEGSFVEQDAEMPWCNPLGFPGYEDKLEKAEETSGEREAVRCGRALLGGCEVAVCAMDPYFIMGSMGCAVGEKICRCVEAATRDGLPLIIFSASGGARMQEGLVSLMQMAKVSMALERHSAAGLLYVSVITDPTTGGVTASFAMQGDIVLAEPKALIGFAGRRVIQDTIKQTLPDDFQTAEFALEHGLIDAIVKRSEMRATLLKLLLLHGCKPRRSAEPLPPAAPGLLHGIGESTGSAGASLREIAHKLRLSLPKPLQKTASSVAARPLDAAANAVDTLGSMIDRFAVSRSGSSLEKALVERGVADAPSIKPLGESAAEEHNRAWESVMLVRNVHRPTSLFYIEAMMDNFIELHGDRSFGDDGAIVGGIGWFAGRPITVIAQEKGADLKQRIARNFGCPQPEGFRKSLRLMRQAEKFGRPILCLVDTQGAYCGVEAEERGQGNAIAENLEAMAGLKVPVVCVVLGEGGSGGALALAVGNRVAMQENAVYSVLSPEGFASILWKDRMRAAEAAAVMKMSAEDVYELGLIDEVVSEGEAPAHENPDQAAASLYLYLVRAFQELEGLSGDELREQRYRRFRAF